MRTSKEEMEEAIRPAGVSIATRSGEVFEGKSRDEGKNKKHFELIEKIVSCPAPTQR